MPRFLTTFNILISQRTRSRYPLQVSSLLLLASLSTSMMGAAVIHPLFVGLSPQLVSGWLSNIHDRQSNGLDPIAQAIESMTPAGRQLRINGHLLNGAWQQQADALGVSDMALLSGVGIDLLDTTQPEQQPIDWFSPNSKTPLVLNAWHDDSVRYLDITDLQTQFSWQVQPQGNVLEITTPPGQITAIRQGQQDWGQRLVIDLTQPVPWQIEQGAGQIKVIVSGAVSPEVINQFTTGAVTSQSNDAEHWINNLQVTQANQRTIFTATPPAGMNAHVWSLTAPHRLVIDFRPDALPPKDIQWAPHLRWQQQYLALGASRFPIYSLTFTPGIDKVHPLPIWANPSEASGISPLISMAHQWQAAAAINGGFFNRNNKLPLGALRYNNRWISGPILGRGAAGWNDQGELFMERLALTQVITAETGATFPIVTINSGFVKAGIAQYTFDWGRSYTSLIDNEIVVTVRNQQVVQQQQLSTAGADTVAIPSDGYLLVMRAFATAARALPSGTQVTLSSQSQPSQFGDYPHILGAGPLLIRQQQVVLDPVAEGFSQNFIEGSAPRSTLCRLANGQWRLNAIHNRVGGRGPTLTETAQLMQRLGCIDALNLDGGSSTSLYLNGQLLNRPPRTAARVHNGLGLFLSPPDR